MLLWVCWIIDLRRHQNVVRTKRWHIWHNQVLRNPLTPMSDQDRISPYNIHTISSKQVMRIKKIYELGDYKLIQYQILQHNITRTVWQTVRRITNEILGVKGLIWSYHILKSSVISYRTHSQQHGIYAFLK